MRPACEHRALEAWYHARLLRAPAGVYRRLADLAALHHLAATRPEAAPLLARLRGLAGRRGFVAMLRRLER